MTISEIVALGSLFISGLALLRSFGKDSKGNTAELTTVIVKLETIESDTMEIKKDIRSVKDDLRTHGERITKAEQKIESIEKIVHMYHRGENIGE